MVLWLFALIRNKRTEAIEKLLFSDQLAVLYIELPE